MKLLNYHMYYMYSDTGNIASFTYYKYFCFFFSVGILKSIFNFILSILFFKLPTSLSFYSIFTYFTTLFELYKYFSFFFSVGILRSIFNFILSILFFKSPTSLSFYSIFTYFFKFICKLTFNVFSSI